MLENVEGSEAQVQRVNDPSPAEVERWKAHLQNGHIPYRRDCRQCIEGAGVGVQHRRVRHPQSYALSADLFGPVPSGEHGRDETCVSGRHNLKYALVGAFRIPRSAVEGDVGSEYAPSEPPPEVVNDLEGLSTPPRFPGTRVEPEASQEELLRELFEVPDADSCARAPYPFSVEAVQGTSQEEQSILLEGDLPQDPKALRELIKDLKEPVEQVVLRYVVPLKGKSGPEVAEGIQKLILSINARYPVRTVGWVKDQSGSLDQEELEQLEAENGEGPSPLPPGASPDRRLRVKTSIRFVECDVSTDSETFARECILWDDYSRESFRTLVGMLPEKLFHSKAGDLAVHRDFRNEWGSLNHAMCIPGDLELWKAPEEIQCQLRMNLRMQTLLTESKGPWRMTYNQFAEHEWKRLNFMGVTEPEDLAYLFEEDLIEIGLKTGEVRLYDRPHQSELYEEDQLEMMYLQSMWEAEGVASQPRVRRVDEAMFTPDVEGLLEKLDGPLEVVHNVAPAEVRSHLEKWRQAATTEVQSLETMGAIRRLRGQEARGVLRSGDVEIIPAKAVCTVKPGSPFKRKVRVVSCGNFASTTEETLLYAGGAGAETLRALLVHNGRRGRRCHSLDVKSAFLLAPIPAYVKKRYAVRPPKLLTELGICAADEIWMIERALYGFRESPRWWSVHRDSVLSTATWNTERGALRLRQLASDSNVWSIELESGECMGHLLIYVDDMLIMADDCIAASFFEWFLGVDIYEDYSPEQLREGQRITGELLWVAQRTRLDVAYSVGLMASLVARSPQYVVKLGTRVLEYLCNTKAHRLTLVPGKADGIRIYTDASFAPHGEHSITGAVLQYDECCVVWKSKRQSLVTLSTAESELVDMQSRGEATVSHCPGDLQLADALTKALPKARHEFLAKLLGLGPPGMVVGRPPATVVTAEVSQITPTEDGGTQGLAGDIPSVEARAAVQRGIGLWLFALALYSQLELGDAAEVDEE
ncbi:GIP, partial [Symbiodinium sp. CCMP2456]